MRVFLLLLILALPAFAANTPPTPVIIRAEMRPGTTYMDVEYRVDDPDDATVRVRALAFVNGTRSFANILRPVTFAEGTAGNIGDNIRSGTKQTLTWNVGADWDIDLGQVKFEILALDSRGLLPFDWITIPAANGQPALTISKDAPSDAAVLNALFWLYADNHPDLTLTSGTLSGYLRDGVPFATQLATGSTVESYGRLFCFKRMNLDDALDTELAYASTNARAGLLNTTKLHAANRTYQQRSIVVGFGDNTLNQINPQVLRESIAIAAGYQHSIALKSDGTVVAWGRNSSGQTRVPVGLLNVTAIAANSYHSVALQSDGTVVAWGNNDSGQTTVPAGLSNVTAIATGTNHSMALKSDGTVIAWGTNSSGQTTIPTGLSGVTAIAAGGAHSLALKSDGTVVAWGYNQFGITTVPAGLSNVTAIAAGHSHSLALKSDGTVVAWGNNQYGQTNIPAGLSNVTAIAAGDSHSLALKSNGTVVAWGRNPEGRTTVPSGVTGVKAIAAGSFHSLVIIPLAP
jgi:hypothetical protein